MKFCCYHHIFPSHNKWKEPYYFIYSLLSDNHTLKFWKLSINNRYIVTSISDPKINFVSCPSGYDNDIRIL